MERDAMFEVSKKIVEIQENFDKQCKAAIEAATKELNVQERQVAMQLAQVVRHIPAPSPKE